MRRPVQLAPPVLAVLVGALLAAAPTGAKTPPCPGGRYVVDGERLLEGDVLPGPDDVFFSPTQVAIASGCRTAAVKLRGSKRGTTLKATWEGCEGATGKVKLKAKLDPSCETLTGTLKAPKNKPRLKRSFGASRASSAVRACDYVPGVSVPATMPPEVVDPPPDPPPPPLDPLPDPTPVSPDATAAQVDLFLALWNAVDGVYVYPDFHGLDWEATGNAYLDLIEQGLTDDDFYAAMHRIIRELGDDHSHYLDPQEVAEQEAKQAAGKNFVGIGAVVFRLPNEIHGSVIAVFPGSPAEAAGLRPHDVLLAVDGLPFFDEDGNGRTRGEEGTSLELTFQRLGEAEQTIELTRARVAGFRPIEACIVPGTRIGYIQLTDFLSSVIDDQIRARLQDMTLEGPLDGLIVDNRLNGGGASHVVEATLGFFTDGLLGHFVSRDAERPLTARAEDVGGTQGVPLVLLADRDTVSFAEVFTGVLGVAGRATIVGGPTRGNVEILHGYDFADDSKLWIAEETFEPLGLPPAYWEDVGVQPDVLRRTRWDLFTEATDPALAEAVELLLAP
jgi:carboxyl-terminal processing protease